jgi:homogentisate 1,2-dioxygenase
MAHYRAVGEVPPKRHTQFRRPDGGLYYEELVGEEGFSSDSSLLYHRELPSAIVDARPWDLPDLSTTPNQPLLPRHLKLHDLVGGEDWKQLDPVTGRRLVLGNGDVRISYVVAGQTSPLYRNAIGDECVYVEAGSAVVETVFGVVDVRQGDYVMLPRATTHRWLPDPAAGPLRAYCIEANSHIAPPKRYLSRYGQLLEHAPYCERDLHGPGEPLLGEGTDVDVLIKHRGQGPGGIAGTVHTYPRHPFDVVGWDGCLYPYTFNISDYEPITGRVHQPPPVHQTFQARNFVVCSFVPRLFDYHPLAIPAPYNHSNINSDEVIYYVAGNFMSRRGVDISSFTVHPAGIPHGPHPGTAEASIGKARTEELAVMVDTFHPLRLTKQAAELDDPAYPYSWLPAEDGGKEASELAERGPEAFPD